MVHTNNGKSLTCSQRMDQKENVCMSNVPTVKERALERMEVCACTASPAPALAAHLGHKRTDFTSEDWT